MKPVRLDFSGSVSWSRWMMGTCSGIAAAVAALSLIFGAGVLGRVCWQAWDIHVQLIATQDGLAATQTARGLRRSIVGPTSTLISPQHRSAWNQVARQLNTPWSSLLDALERATPDNIALLSIEPDGARGSIRLQAEAKNLESLLAYAGALKAIDVFESVVLIRHETNDQDSNRPLRLSLDIRLKDAMHPSEMTSGTAGNGVGQ